MRKGKGKGKEKEKELELEKIWWQCQATG